MLTRKTPLKRGGPLKRTGGLKRTSKLPQKRKGGPRRSSRVRDEAYLAFVRTLACCSCGRRAPSNPNHATEGRGLSQKADDDRTVPNCRPCHDAFHDGKGRFAGMGKMERREWHAEMVAYTQTLHFVHSVVSGNVPEDEEVA